MLAVPAGANNAFAGQLLVAWHGYRAGGHRIVSHALDAKGRPTGAPRIWVDGWSAQVGVRPLGAPTGIAVDAAGRLLIVEDRHKTVLMLSRERPLSVGRDNPGMLEFTVRSTEGQARRGRLVLNRGASRTGMTLRAESR